ncbi:hypothetical protein E2320_000012 [Naja naja]|nr:hypothetical protein E2320_000012 [Naja naja]
MDQVLKRPWVGVFVFFCVAMIPSVTGDSCTATAHFEPQAMMRTVANCRTMDIYVECGGNFSRGDQYSGI